MAGNVVSGEGSGEPVREALGPLAAAEGVKPAQLAQLMLRLRRSLRAYLEAEGAEI